MDTLEHIDRYPLDIRNGIQDRYIETLKTFIYYSPRDPDLWYALGEYCKQIGMLKEAESALLECVELDSHQEFAWFQLAMVYEHLGMREEADASWTAWDNVKMEQDILAIAIVSQSDTATEAV